MTATATTAEVTARNVETTLPAGTVFTFTSDPSRGTSPMFARRPVGAHYVSHGLSVSGYCVIMYNTHTGRTDQIMAEDWVLSCVRIIPVDYPKITRP